MKKATLRLMMTLVPKGLAFAVLVISNPAVQELLKHRLEGTIIP